MVPSPSLGKSLGVFLSFFGGGSSFGWSGCLGGGITFWREVWVSFYWGVGGGSTFLVVETKNIGTRCEPTVGLFRTMLRGSFKTNTNPAFASVPWTNVKIKMSSGDRFPSKTKRGNQRSVWTSSRACAWEISRSLQAPDQGQGKAVVKSRCSTQI